MRKKILLVDDDKSIALTVKELFVSKGYEVSAVFTGKEAIEHLDTKNLDLVLLDIQLPDVNGVEILRQVKRRHPRMKTVVLTGFLDEYRDEIEKLGCDAVLNKPFSINTLINAVDSNLFEKKDTKKVVSGLLRNPKILTKAKLLFVEPNEIMYSAKSSYFQDPTRCKGRYKLAVAFDAEQFLERLDDFKPDIVLSDIAMYRLYKLGDKIKSSLNPPKDVILYGILGLKDDTDKVDIDASVISGFFDPITLALKPAEMDKLGRIVRSAAISHDLYIKILKLEKKEGIKTKLLRILINLTHRVLFQKAPNYRKILIQASKGIVLITELQKLLNLIVLIVKKHIRLKSACIFLYDKEEGSFILKSRRGDNKHLAGYKVQSNHPLIRWLKEKQDLIVRSELESDKESEDFEMFSKVKKELENLGGSLCVPSFCKGELLGFLVLGDKLSCDMWTLDERELLSMLSNEVAIAIENARNFMEIERLREREKQNYLQTVLALAKTVDEKDSYTRGHLDEVERYGIEVAKELFDMKGMRINMEELRTALLLHDIGKLGVPDALLNKKGKLTTKEWIIMRQHPEVGARIVEPIEKLKNVVRIIRHHQEKYNGTGYPDGLKGEEIPLESRIIAVVDAYHAMVSDRPYRKPLSEKVALEELVNNKGTQFDPIIVDAFMRAREKGMIRKSEAN